MLDYNKSKKVGDYMKKCWLIIGLLTILTACNASNTSNKLEEATLKSYPFTAQEQHLLSSLGLIHQAEMISFYAPHEAITLKINIYQLNHNGEWESIDNTGISIGEEREPSDYLAGTLAIIFDQNQIQQFTIHTDSSGITYKAPQLITQSYDLSARALLTADKKIRLNEEIPVALWVATSTGSLPSFSVESFETPSRFQTLDVVQALTLTFTEEEL